MENNLDHLVWHRGFGHRHGFGRAMWRGYGFPYRRWHFYPRGGCCGPLFFLLLLVGLMPLALFLAH